MGLDPSELLPIVVATLIAAAAILALLRVRRVASRALRMALLVLTGLLTVTSVLVAAASIFFYVAYTRHLGPLGSPDHRYVAITTYTVNTGAGSDQVEVALRRVGSPYARRVYIGPAQYEPNAAVPEPALRWLDDAHLEVAFHTYLPPPGTRRTALPEQGCAHRAGEITIDCVETRVHAVR